MKRAHVAVVSIGYPPMQHVAGLRASRMAAELVRLGHRVSVVTLDYRADPGRGVTDEEGVRVLRVDPRDWYPEFEPAARPLVIEPPTRIVVARRARTVLRMARWGPFEPWARSALPLLIDRHAEEPVDIVWAIHGDASAHEVAFRFHRQSGVPWVADFKDPWDLWAPQRTARAMLLAITMRRLASAAALTEAAGGQAAVDAARFRKAAHVIWSGYDASLMAASEPSRVSDAFCVLYMGHLSPVQHDVAAIGRLMAEMKVREVRVELHLFGHPSPEVQRILTEHGAVPTNVVHHSFVDQQAAFALMRGADALLLLPANHHNPSGASVGVKELEYFASGAPVLCLGGLLPEIGQVAGALPQTIVRAAGREAADGLLELVRAKQKGGAVRGVVNHPDVLRYAWPNQAKKLATVLTAIARPLG